MMDPSIGRARVKDRTCQPKIAFRMWGCFGGGCFAAYRSYQVWYKYDNQPDVKEDEHEP